MVKVLSYINVKVNIFLLKVFGVRPWIVRFFASNLRRLADMNRRRK